MSAKLFAKRFIIFSGVIILLIFIVNYIVNPYGVFAINKFRPLVWSSRSIKNDMLAKTRESPEIIVLGSSRSMKISPEYIRLKTNFETFNYAVDAACTEDFYAQLRYIIEDLKLKPRYIIVGIDLEAFHNNTRPNDGLMNDARLARYITGDSQIKAYFAKIGHGLSYGMLKSSIQSVKLHISGFPEKYSGFDETGFLHYYQWEKQIAAGTFQPNIDVKYYENRFNNFTSLSSKRKQYFLNFLQEAEKNNIKVIGFITTLNQSYIDHIIQRHEYDHLFMEMQLFLRQAQQEHTSFTFFDCSTTAKYEGDEALFYDAIHIREENANKIIDYILDNARLNGVKHAF